MCFAFVPTGKAAVAAGGRQQTSNVILTASGALLRSFPHSITTRNRGPAPSPAATPATAQGSRLPSAAVLGQQQQQQQGGRRGAQGCGHLARPELVYDVRSEYAWGLAHRLFLEVIPTHALLPAAWGVQQPGSACSSGPRAAVILCMQDARSALLLTYTTVGPVDRQFPCSVCVSAVLRPWLLLCLRLCHAGPNKLDLQTALSVTAVEYMDWLVATGAEDLPADGEGETARAWSTLQPLHPQLCCVGRCVTWTHLGLAVLPAMWLTHTTNSAHWRERQQAASVDPCVRRPL